jgi:hypothetical protein
MDKLFVDFIRHIAHRENYADFQCVIANVKTYSKDILIRAGRDFLENTLSKIHKKYDYENISQFDINLREDMSRLIGVLIDKIDILYILFMNEFNIWTEIYDIQKSFEC